MRVHQILEQQVTGSMLGLDVGDTVRMGSGLTFRWAGGSWVVTDTGDNSSRRINQMANEAERETLTNRARAQKGLPPIEFENGRPRVDANGRPVTRTTTPDADTPRTQPNADADTPRTQPNVDRDMRALHSEVPTQDQLTASERARYNRGQSFTREVTGTGGRRITLTITPDMVDEQTRIRSGGAPLNNPDASTNVDADADGNRSSWKKWKDRLVDFITKYTGSALGGTLVGIALKAWSISQLAELYSQYDRVWNEIGNLSDEDAVSSVGEQKLSELGDITKEIETTTTDYFMEALGGAIGTAVGAGVTFMTAGAGFWTAVLFGAIGGTAGALGLKRVPADWFFDDARDGENLGDFFKETIVRKYLADDISSRAQGSPSFLAVAGQFQLAAPGMLGPIAGLLNLRPLDTALPTTSLIGLGTDLVKTGVSAITPGESIQEDNDEDNSNSEETMSAKIKKAKRQVASDSELKRLFALGKSIAREKGIDLNQG